MNVTDFKSSFNNLARTTLFKVDLSGQGIDGRNFQFRAKGATLPGGTMGVIEVPYMGRKIKIPGDRTYEQWTVTILGDESFDIHTALYEWMRTINDPVLNVGVSNIETIKEDATITTLNRDGSDGVVYKIVGIWPSTVAPIQFGWDTNDTPVEFDVTFEVDYVEKV